MKHFFTILSHEVRMLLVNPSTYTAAFFFLTVMGFLFTGLLETYTKPQEFSPASVFFELFWIPVFFMVPLLTMRSISEERRLGTLETLLTTPVTTTEVVLGKYTAAYLLYLALWSATGGYFYILHRFAGGDNRFLDPGPLIGGYAFIAISGLLFVAIGIFASAMSRNQAVAALFSFVLLFGATFGLRFADTLQALNNAGLHQVKTAVGYAQVFTHLDDFTRGVIDSRHILFYVSGTVLALIFSILGVEGKRLHS